MGFECFLNYIFKFTWFATKTTAFCCIEMLNETYHSKIKNIYICEKVDLKFAPIGSGVLSHKS